MGRPAVVPPAGRGGGLDARPCGGVGPTYLHKKCHSVILAGQLAGPRGRGWAGRRLCRPPAREEGWMRAPARALAERGWGAFYESAEGGAAGSEIGALPGGRRGMCGPRGLDPYV